jgi:hypothetical protein
MPRARLFYVGSALFATWIVWGSTYLAIRIALPELPPFLQMGSRFLVAGLLLLVIGWACGTRLPSFAEWRSASIVGTLLLAGGAGGTAFAEQSVASGLAASFKAWLYLSGPTGFARWALIHSCSTHGVPGGPLE